MYINTEIISNSDMIKKYKTCREKAETHGKIFVVKNNKPDAVLFSITEYQRISGVLEYLESLDEKDVAKVMDSLPKSGIRNNYPIEDLVKDTK